MNGNFDPFVLSDRSLVKVCQRLRSCELTRRMIEVGTLGCTNESVAKYVDRGSEGTSDMQGRCNQVNYISMLIGVGYIHTAKLER